MRKIIILLISLPIAGVLVWPLWINPKVERTYIYDSENGLFDPLVCGLDASLKDTRLTVAYPKSINKGGLAQIEIWPVFNWVNENSDAKSCNWAFEVLLQMDHAFITPRETIIQPVTAAADQVMKFEIRARESPRVLEGRLWIYVLSGGEGLAMTDRTPLFVIPLEIEVRSLFGVPPGWASSASFAILALLALLRWSSQGAHKG